MYLQRLEYRDNVNESVIKLRKEIIRWSLSKVCIIIMSCRLPAYLQ